MTSHHTTASPSPAERDGGAASCAPVLLSPGQQIAGFTVLREERIDELDATAFELAHVASGARLLYLACADDNKAFAIGFKTPPANDTGVFHILEHSVLCGSAKFPVKEPFVDLIKTSMQTFLNAMTYPDKTVYPVASTNEQDLLNLMDVYMDAVLNPAIYAKPTIFQQEGWHYELDVPEGSNPSEGRLRLNGVVFNEMKGALSDPSDVLDDAVSRALFPDTAYACESGGDPRAIPDLTYEEFLDTHARHYDPANSYLVLYGNLHVERELTLLDEGYLCDAARAASAASKRAALGLPDGSAFGAPNELAAQAPVVCPYRRIEMDTTPENAQVGLAFVLGDVLDRERIVAADVLFETLLGSNEAPVKRAILDAGVGGDVMAFTQATCLQPYELVLLRSAKPEAAQAFRSAFLDACRALADQGIPRERLEATISSNEYDLRQRDYGTADGVVLALDALSTWLYDDGAATLGLKYADIFADLRAKLDTGYFEQLLRDLVLDSSHWALVELVPHAAEGPDPEAARLAAVQEGMDENGLIAVAQAEAALRRAQEAPDAPEDKAKLPRLTVADIGEKEPEPRTTVDTTAPLPCLVHPIPTNRLAYALAYFDISGVSYQELPYVTVLARLLTKLDTDRMRADELDSYIKSNLGFLSFSTEVYVPDNPRLAAPKLVAAAGALSEKIDCLARIPQEIWGSTRFDDTDRMRDVLTQMRINLEQGFLNAGHGAAMARAFSYVSPAGVVREQLGGVDFYRWLRDLLEHFDDRKEALCEKLRELAARIFVSDGAVMSFIGSGEDYRRWWDAAGNLGLEPRTAPVKELYVPAPEDKREAFIIPSDICFCAQAHDPRMLGLETPGSWAVAAGALSYDYLWNEVRVKGGAYGCGFRVLADRQLAFYSYRDPALDATLARFADAGAWLAGFEPDDAAFEGLVVSTTAAHDAPVKPFAQGRRQDAAYFSRRPCGFRRKQRAEILATTPDDLHAVGAGVRQMAAAAPVCVFGSRELVEANHAGLTPVDLLA